MNRRLFFAAIAGLPFVGKLVPKEYDAADFFDPGSTKGTKFSDLPTATPMTPERLWQQYMEMSWRNVRPFPGAQTRFLAEPTHRLF